MRDLLKDLEICKAATSEYMDVLDGDDRLEIATVDRERSRVIEYIALFCGVNQNNDVRFYMEAREGWPYAIDRALTAEAERDQLRRDIAEVLGESTKLQNDCMRRIERLSLENGRLEAERDGLRRELDTANQALEAAERRVKVLEAVAEAAKEALRQVGAYDVTIGNYHYCWECGYYIGEMKHKHNCSAGQLRDALAALDGDPDAT